MLNVDIQQAPPRPGRDQVSVNCSAWEILKDRSAIARQWILRGLNGRDDITTVEVVVSSDHIVTMVAEPGISPSTVAVEAQLTVEGQPEKPFIILQHRPIPERPGATVFAPVDLNGLKALLEALWQCAGMKLTMISGGQALLQAPLYNDPSYREAFARV